MIIQELKMMNKQIISMEKQRYESPEVWEIDLSIEGAMLAGSTEDFTWD